VERVTRGLAAAFAVVLVGVSVAHADTSSDTRYTWSWDEFASYCGFESATYLRANRDWFSDRNYSDKWNRTSEAKLKTCSDCYRVADVAKLGPAVRVVQLIMTSDSGDWSHEITYYFDSNDKLRATSAIFDCAWGWSYVTVYAFHEGGLKLRDSRWQKLESGKQISRPEDADEWEDHWSRIPVYKLFSQLPFAKLITN
jgi:hypothetical protein